MEALKHQIGGDHYHKRTIQPIEFILANGLGFCEGSVVKYITRWDDKGGIEDLRKAKHYIEFLIEKEMNKIGQEPMVWDADEQRAPEDKRPGGRTYDRLVPRAIDDPYPYPIHKPAPLF